MPNPRSKRKALRESRKRKAQEDDADQLAKRQRRGEDEAGEEQREGEAEDYGHDGDAQQQNENAGEAQFFGLLSDEEQEYFRGAAEVLELNTFPTPEERDVFVENVFKEAQGKELKLACSQSCSRLMEKLILLSTKAQKKHLFEAFAGHFLSLVQHRFASHCCEMLFLQSAPLVGEEFGGFVIDTQGEKSVDGEEHKVESSMEHLFLLTLDELEADLTFLLTQTYASHTLRALLLILSGRPLEDASTAALLKSKKKERISVPGAAPPTAENAGQQLRAVPESFALATQKIISDTMMAMDSSSLRVLVTHPTGNPLLQLLLELDISLNVKSKSKDEKTASGGTLLDRLLPGAPDSLKDESSKASEFVTSLIYDQIGSRLLETLIVHAPSKIFKAIYQNFFAQRIQSYVRNEIASYPSIKVLNRLGRDELIACVNEIIPAIPTLVEKGRFNVIKTLFERCSAREAPEEITKVTNALVAACDGDAENLIPRLCHLRGDGDDAQDKKNMPQYLVRSQQAVVNHGAQLISTMLTTGGSSAAAAAAAQTSLLGLTSEELLKLATGSMATMSVITTALSQPATPTNPNFHKSLVASLLAHAADLATSQSGHNIVNEIISIPSRGKERSAPFHLKEALMVKLAENEQTLRDSWMGRSVWRTWKGDVWKRGRGDWARWARETGDGAEQAFAAAPMKRERRFGGGKGGPKRANGVAGGSRPAVVPANPYIARRMARRAEREKMQGKEEFTQKKRERESVDEKPMKEATREVVVEEKSANGTDGVEQDNKKKEKRENKYKKAKKERQEKRERKEKEGAVVEA